MRLSKMLFFLCFRPTVKFQDGSPVDPLFDPPADPPFDSTSQKFIFIVISASLIGALGEFRGILGAALGIGNSILGVRNSILGMASHDLINTKPAILGATLGAIPGIAANPPERFSFAPSFSERFFENWGGPRAQEFFWNYNCQTKGA